jgi:hypothetical protein
MADVGCDRLSVLGLHLGNSMEILCSLRFSVDDEAEDEESLMELAVADAFSGIEIVFGSVVDFLSMVIVELTIFFVGTYQPDER